MDTRVVVEPAGDVPRDAEVRHVDELHPDAQDCLPELAAEGDARVPADVAESLTSCDLVKFTDYYRVDCS